MQEFDFKKDVEINPNQLDVEWLRQPALYQKYSEACAEANDDLKRAEQRMKVIRSELILEASERGEDVLGKGVKPTGPTIEAYYRNHKEHQDAKEEYFKAAKRAEMLTNALFALQQKKVALENLVRLLTSNYFASPSVPRDLSAEWGKTVEQTKGDQQAEVAEKMGERRRRRE